MYILASQAETLALLFYIVKCIVCIYSFSRLQTRSQRSLALICVFSVGLKGLVESFMAFILLLKFLKVFPKGPKAIHFWSMLLI